MTDEPDSDDLFELVVECLDRIEDSGLTAIDAVCDEHPERASALRSRMSVLLGTGLVESDRDVPERLGDFRLGERLGGGGMGIVYAAVQESLGREVALKLLRPDQLLFPEARERFRREVQLVARLQHPGIVPIFTVGEERGVPYFAMERITGATLAQVLGPMLARVDAPRTGRDLADAVSAVTGCAVTGDLFAGSWEAACLRIGRSVGEALHYAHGRGVLHRDVKPSNVMVTADGRALLFDFGLASARGSDRLTKTGAQVGSLAYMSPEQVRGEGIDERTDVYGLGATLCELLTGAPPFSGRGGALVSAILAGDPVAIRRRRPSVSRDTETVCHNALDREPARRYATAYDFARDLGNVLAHRPIETRRAGPLLRAGRWAQRHPARALALVLALAAPTALAIQQAHAAGRVTAQRDRAEANLDKALAAIEVFLWDVGRIELEGVPHMEEARLRLLEEALAFFEDLMPQRPDDSALLLRWAELQRSMGEVLSDLGRLAEAETCFREQIAVFSQRDGLDQEQRHDLVGALNNLANVVETQGGSAEAVVLYEEAARALGSARDPRSLAALCNVERNRGRALVRLERPEEADAAYTTAVATAEALGDDYELGAALSGYSEALLRAGDLDRARSTHARALSLILGLAASAPDDPKILHEATFACLNAIDRTSVDEQPEILSTGLKLAERLVADYPLTPEYARTLAKLQTNLGVALMRGADLAGAEAQFRSALATSERLTGDVFEDVYVRGMAAHNLAQLLVQMGRADEALATSDRAIASLEQAVALRPDNADVRYSLAWARVQQGYARIASKDFDRAEDVVAPVPGLLPDDPRVHVAVAEVLANCPQVSAKRALAALARGLELGFDDMAYLRSSPELQPIASLPEFQSLLTATP